MRKVFLCVLALLMLAVSVSATTSFITDESGLLTPEQTSALNEKLAAYHENFGVSVGIVTAEDLYGQTIEDYAQSCYAEGGYSNDGALLVVCENEGQWYLYTSGLCRQSLSDGELAQLSRTITDDLQAGNHAQLFTYVAEAVAEPACQEIKTLEEKALQHQKNQKTYIFLGLLAGLLAGIGVSVLLWFKAKSIKPTMPQIQAIPVRRPRPAQSAQPQRRVRPPFPGEERRDDNR